MATTIARPTVNRAVHLKITPRPSNTGESREIMRLMSSQFGEIEYFKSFRHERIPAAESAVIIFKQDSMAQECMRQSPIRFRLGRADIMLQQQQKLEEELANEESASTITSDRTDMRSATPAYRDNNTKLPRGPVGMPFGLEPSTSSRSFHSSSFSRASSQQSGEDRRPPPPGMWGSTSSHKFDLLSSSSSSSSSSFSHTQLSQPRVFQIQTQPAHRHFRDRINVSHYHGPFAIDTKSIGQQDLARHIPFVGMSDVNWRAADKPWRLIRKEKEKDFDPVLGRKKSLFEVWEERGMGKEVG